MNLSEVNKPLYLRFWKRILRETLDWPEARVVEWARQFEDGLNGIDTCFYRELPSYYVVPLLTPDRLAASFDWHDQLMFGQDFVRTIVGIGRKYRCEDANYDFRAARKRIEAFLAGYGETIPDRK